MPQLGMTQDSGVIVSWRKKPGDRVKAEDMLMEVETDKSTMEVEAGHDGFLAEVRAAAGAAVPVGDVVAVISDERTTSSRRFKTGEAQRKLPTGPKCLGRRAAGGARAEHLRVAGNARARSRRRGGFHGACSATLEARRSRRRTHPGLARKAKLAAERRGIDLSRLVRQGLPEPFHVADLEKLVPERQAGGTSLSALSATTERCDFEAFCDWVRKEADARNGPGRDLGGLRRAAWRACLGLDGPAGLTVRVETLVPIPTGRVV